jgi:circadian clock protein KaiC
MSIDRLPVDAAVTTNPPGMSRELAKSPTGIRGLDDILTGGLPRGRPTLIAGSAGCGKTLLSMEFVARGAMEFGEPGVFMSFEERADELAQNVRSLGIDVDDLIARRLLVIDHVHLERSEIDETGDYDLDGLFIRLGYAIDTVGARRVVLDTLESLFSGLTSHAILRAELGRLFRWLKDRGVTAIITCERGDGTLTRHGLEEYVSDCVILLDHRVEDQISTRRLRVVKYRGSAHGADEYPFLIDAHGISVLPVTSLGLEHPAFDERFSTGVPRLDAMLGGDGFYRGSTVLVSGTAGTGKSSLAAHFAAAACRRGERCLYFAFEESTSQIIRNMRSIGLDLEPAVASGLLRFSAARPTLFGIEMHLATAHRIVDEFQPAVVILDPITSLVMAGTRGSAESMLLRLIDFLKSKGITALFTSLTSGKRDGEELTEVGVSSVVDTWILLRDIESNGERNRGMYVLKSRGMAHSNQIREFVLTSRGIELRDMYVGNEGVLTGSSRVAQEAREAAAATHRHSETDRKRREVERKRKALDARIAALRADFEAESSELERLIEQDRAIERHLIDGRNDIATSRRADVEDDGETSARRTGDS